MKNIIIFVSLIWVSTSVNAANFYYCDCLAGASAQCAAGVDTSAGTSPSTPRRTYDKAATQFSSLNGGDSIKFCRGGSFNTIAAKSWVNNNSTQSSQVTVTDYTPSGQAAAPRPIITSTFNSNATRIFNFSNTGARQAGYLFSNLDLRCTGCLASGSSVGFFFYGPQDYVTIKNIAITGFRIGVQLAEPTNTTGGTSLNNITISNLTIKNSKGQGFLGGANNLLIENSYFENNGGGTNRDHNIYVSNGNNIIIRNNELYRSSMDSSGKCAGTSLVIHSHGTKINNVGILNTILIEGNTVREDVGKAGPGCYGISVNAGYPAAEGFRNVTIRGNTVVNVGNKSIGLSACQNCTIENNLIFHQQPFNVTAISAPNLNTNRIDPLDMVMTNIRVRNNSIYITTGGTGVKLDISGTQHTIVSNAIHYSGVGTFSCLNAGLPMTAYTAIDNNVCYFPNTAAASEWEFGSGSNPTPLTAWRTISGKGANSKRVDPGFVNPLLPQLDFTLQNLASGAINAGHSTLSSPVDFRSKTRGGQPDAGAYEYGTFNPPAKTFIYLK